MARDYLFVVGVSCVLQREELYHISLSVKDFAVLPAAVPYEWYPAVDAMLVHRASGNVVSFADLLLRPSFFVRVKDAEALKSLRYLLRHMVDLAVKTCLDIPDLRCQFSD